MALFQRDDGEIYNAPDNFDPKTGENLTINDVLNQASQKGINVRPVMIFAHPDKPKDTVAVGYNEFKKATDAGFKPLNQIEAEKNAQEAAEKVKSGDINVDYSPVESFGTGALKGATLGLAPNILSAGQALKQKLSGNSDNFGDLYKNNLNAAQSVLESQRKQNPISSVGGEIAGSFLPAAATGMGSEGLTLKGIGSDILKGGVLGGTEKGINSVNQGNTLEDVGKDVGEGAQSGAEWTLGGHALTGLAKSAYDIGKPLIPKAVSKYFGSAAKGENYNNPNFVESVAQDEYNIPHDIVNTLKSSKQEVGAQQRNIIKNLGNDTLKNPVDPEKIRQWDDLNEKIANHKSDIEDAIKKQPSDVRFNPTEENIKNFYENFKNPEGNSIGDLLNQKQKLWTEINGQGPSIIQKNYLDHSDLYDAMKDAKYKLLKQSILDQDPDTQMSIQEALKKINGNITSLENNPNNPEIIQKIKGRLQDVVYNKDKIPVKEIRDIVQKPSQVAMDILEKASQPIENAPEEYKSNQLGNVNKAYKAFLEAEDPKSHLEQLYLRPNDIQEISKGPFMRPDVKNRWENFKNFVDEVSNNPSVSDDIKNKMQDFITRIPKTGQRAQLMRDYNSADGVKGIMNQSASKLGDAFYSLSPAVQDLILKSPDFAKRMAPILGTGISEQKGNTQNGGQ